MKQKKSGPPKELKEHIRTICSFGYDPFTEEGVERTAKEVLEDIAMAKKGRTFALRRDIWEVSFALYALGKKEAYPAMKAYIAYILKECPHMRDEIAHTLERIDPELKTALL